MVIFNMFHAKYPWRLSDSRAMSDTNGLQRAHLQFTKNLRSGLQALGKRGIFSKSKRAWL